MAPTIEKPRRKVKFNADNTVDVETPAGQKFKFTRDEYSRYNEQISGGSTNLTKPGFTPQVNEAVAIQKKNEQARAIAAGNQTVAVPTSAPNASISLPGQTAANTVQVQPQPLSIVPPVLTPNLNLQAPQEQAAPSLVEGIVNPQSNQGVKDFVNQQMQPQSPLQSALVIPRMIKLIAREAVELGTAIKSFGVGDTGTVKNIKNEFNDVKSGLDKQITAVSQGFGDPQALADNYQKLVIAVENLEVESKRKGIDNLPYWLTTKEEGLAGDIDGMKSQLEGIRQDIDAAVVQGNKVKQAQYLKELENQAAIEQEKALQEAITLQ